MTMRTALNLTLAVALVATLGACSRRAPQELPPAPTDQGTGGMGQGGMGGAAVPGSQADFVASVAADRVFFDTDRYNIDGTDRATLDSQAQWLQRYPNVRVLIEGHADERGTRDYNLALGQRRAEAARNYLISAGITANRIDVISYGKERPEAVGSDEQSWAQNRRAVTVTIQ
jgi:peptidoglycan-associated lipoprotein